MSELRFYVIAATIALLNPTDTNAQPCPVAKLNPTSWVRHQSADFGIELLAAPVFRAVEWSSRSDSTSLRFSLWQDASTRIEFLGSTHWSAKTVTKARGPSCTVRTSAADVRLKIWRSVGGLPDGRDTTYFNAGGDLVLPGKPRMIVWLHAHDSVTLLSQLQMFQTLRLLK